ncbi:MAG: DUF3572 domain-containing protein [Albidovulum sp.]
MQMSASSGREYADTVALKALVWLVSHEDLLPTFLGASGTSAEEVRGRVTDPDFLIAVLDFIMMNDEWVMAFCDAEGLDYTAPMAARQGLPGGTQSHWT